jgi:hypothetical protein
VLLPAAYLVGPEQEQLLEILTRHRIELDTLEQSMALPVRRTTLHHITPTMEEELEVPNVDASSEVTLVDFPVGSVAIPVAQPAKWLLPVLIEAESTRGLTTEGAGRHQSFGHWLEVGSHYPVYRIRQWPPR